MKNSVFFACLMVLISLLHAQGAPIRLNSIGFLPDGIKKATVVAACESFSIKNIETGEAVFSGKATGPFSQKDVNQQVWQLDFSDFKTPGTYALAVEGAGTSIPFRIAADVFNQPFYTSMRAMYLWRCGTAVEGMHNGMTYKQEACHLEDGWGKYIGEPGKQFDGTGGWHDAGDYGKYVVNAGITVASMLFAWEHFQPQIEKIKLDIPETAPGYPDYLKEIKWETDWVMKMQYPDGSGRVSHKLTRTNFSGFIMPSEDNEKRYFTVWSSAATADFVATLAMAARAFKPYDKAYAQKCIEAAKKSYAYLKANPENHGFEQGDFRTGAYGTGDPDDRIWAAAEMWETIGDISYLQEFEALAREHEALVDVEWDWGRVANLGLFTYLLSEREGKDAELFAKIKNSAIEAANTIVADAENDIYGRTHGGRYYWGCNGTVARQVINLQVAHKLAANPKYIETSIMAVDHILGRNYYGRSYVTGLGHNPPMAPHDRRSGADDIEAPWPGYIVGGGHSATDWIDKQESYSHNEIAINWQGALIYALASLISEQ